MDAVPSAFNNLFTTINNTFSKESSDCIATLCSATDFIKYMVSPPEGAVTHRKHRLTVAELKRMLNWSSPDPSGHPLADLDALLQVEMCTLIFFSLSLPTPPSQYPNNLIRINPIDTFQQITISSNNIIIYSVLCLKM